MRDTIRRLSLVGSILAGLLAGPAAAAEIGSEVAIPTHLQDGSEQTLSLEELLAHGQRLMNAVFTVEEGQGRPLTKGTGAGLADPFDPLIFPRSFNRVSAPDASSCAGCHAQPFGVGGGDGDVVANVFVLGQRFDFATFDGADFVPTKGARDESGAATTLPGIGNSRLTLGMWGSGFIEMLARQMTQDLQAIRDSIPPGSSAALETKGISFGALARGADGSWDVSGIEGLGAASLQTSGPASPPSLIIRPFHQAGRVISLREFTNNALNHHHGMQSTERFGDGTDPDGDGVISEITRADVTALTLFQATMAVPGQVIPRDRAVERAIFAGDALFDAIECSRCHVKTLPLDRQGWIFTEPGPFNPPGNLRPEDTTPLAIDLTDPRLAQPRLEAKNGVVHVPAFTDLKLHDITFGADDPNREPLDMHEPPGSPEFFAGNSRFLTRKLWGTGNTPPFFHHGQYTTLRESILAHHGEATNERLAFEALSSKEQAFVIEFLKSLQVLRPGTASRLVDESYHPRGSSAEAHAKKK